MKTNSQKSLSNRSVAQTNGVQLTIRELKAAQTLFETFSFEQSQPNHNGMKMSSLVGFPGPGISS